MTLCRVRARRSPSAITRNLRLLLLETYLKYLRDTLPIRLLTRLTPDPSGLERWDVCRTLVAVAVTVHPEAAIDELAIALLIGVFVWLKDGH